MGRRKVGFKAALPFSSTKYYISILEFQQPPTMAETPWLMSRTKTGEWEVVTEIQQNCIQILRKQAKFMNYNQETQN